MRYFTQRLQQIFRAVSVRSLLVILLAGVLLLTNTACDRTRAATPVNPTTSSRSGQGMYPTSDTVGNNRAAEKKADQLVREAEKRLERVQTPGELADEVTPDQSIERQAEDAQRAAKRAAEDAGQSTRRAAEKAAESTRRGLRNLQENTEDALDSAANKIDQAT